MLDSFYYAHQLSELKPWLLGAKSGGAPLNSKGKPVAESTRMRARHDASRALHSAILENDPACGRGWAAIGTAGRLVGHFFIHNGDDSAFVCEPG